MKGQARKGRENKIAAGGKYKGLADGHVFNRAAVGDIENAAEKAGYKGRVSEGPPIRFTGEKVVEHRNKHDG